MIRHDRNFIGFSNGLYIVSIGLGNMMSIELVPRTWWNTTSEHQLKVRKRSCQWWHQPIMMIVEMSKTVVIWCNLHTFFFLANVWLIFCGRVTSKLQNVVFYHNETVTFLYPELRVRVYFFLQAQSLPSLLRTLPATLVRQTAAYKCFQSIWKYCLFVCV